MTEPAYTEQDLREAERVAEELAKPKAYWECDWSGETDGTERLTIYKELAAAIRARGQKA